jgi:hypothetical protein
MKNETKYQNTVTGRPINLLGFSRSGQSIRYCTDCYWEHSPEMCPAPYLFEQFVERFIDCKDEEPPRASYQIYGTGEYSSFKLFLSSFEELLGKALLVFKLPVSYYNEVFDVQEYNNDFLLSIMVKYITKFGYTHSSTLLEFVGDYVVDINIPNPVGVTQTKPDYKPESEYKIYGTGEFEHFYRSFTDERTFERRAVDIWFRTGNYIYIPPKDHQANEDFLKSLRVKRSYIDYPLDVFLEVIINVGNYSIFGEGEYQNFKLSFEDWGELCKAAKDILKNPVNYIGTAQGAHDFYKSLSVSTGINCKRFSFFDFLRSGRTKHKIYGVGHSKLVSHPPYKRLGDLKSSAIWLWKHSRHKSEIDRNEFFKDLRVRLSFGEVVEFMEFICKFWPDEVFLICGVDKANSFNMLFSSEESLEETAIDIWKNASKYSQYENDSENEFTKFLWLVMPGKEDVRLADYVNMTG